MHIDTNAVVLDREDESITRNACANGQLTTFRSVGEPVNDRVFDERLQQKVRHRDVLRLGRRLDVDAEPISEPALLNVQVRAEESKLVAQRNVAAAGVTQRFDEQSAQVPECAPRRGGIAKGELRDEVQCVEEEVRVQLQLQHVQSGAGE